MTRTHDLKCWPEVFAAVRSGIKRCEFRRDDRQPSYAVGHVLRLREWDPTLERYTGKQVLVCVLHIIRGPDFGIPAGYALMSVAVVEKSNAKA